MIKPLFIKIQQKLLSCLLCKDTTQHSWHTVKLELERHTQWRDLIQAIKRHQLMAAFKYQTLVEEVSYPEQWIKFSNIFKNAQILIQLSW